MFTWANTTKCHRWNQCISAMCVQKPATMTPPALWGEHRRGQAACISQSIRDIAVYSHQNTFAECFTTHTTHIHHTLFLSAVFVFQEHRRIQHLCRMWALYPGWAMGAGLPGAARGWVSMKWDQQWNSGAGGTMSISMNTWMSECISSLLPGGYYYYLCLSSI